MVTCPSRAGRRTVKWPSYTDTVVRLRDPPGKRDYAPEADRVAPHSNIGIVRFPYIQSSPRRHRRSPQLQFVCSHRRYARLNHFQQITH